MVKSPESEEKDRIIINQELELTDLRVSSKQKDILIKELKDHIFSIDSHD